MEERRRDRVIPRRREPPRHILDVVVHAERLLHHHDRPTRPHLRAWLRTTPSGHRPCRSAIVRAVIGSPRRWDDIRAVEAGRPAVHPIGHHLVGAQLGKRDQRRRATAPGARSTCTPSDEPLIGIRSSGGDLRVEVGRVEPGDVVRRRRTEQRGQVRILRRGDTDPPEAEHALLTTRGEGSILRERPQPNLGGDTDRAQLRLDRLEHGPLRRIVVSVQRHRGDPAVRERRRQPRPRHVLRVVTQVRARVVDVARHVTRHDRAQGPPTRQRVGDDLALSIACTIACRNRGSLYVGSARLNPSHSSLPKKVKLSVPYAFVAASSWSAAPTTSRCRRSRTLDRRRPTTSSRPDRRVGSHVAARRRRAPLQPRAHVVVVGDRHTDRCPPA